MGFVIGGGLVAGVISLGSGADQKVMAAEIRQNHSKILEHKSEAKEEIQEIKSEIKELRTTVNETNQMVRDMHAVFKLHDSMDDGP